MVCLGGSFLLLLDACQPLPVYKTVSENKKLRIPLEQFGENNFIIVQPSDLNYDIAVLKNSDTEFQSFVMVCTHADNPVRFNGQDFKCSLHGSIFNRNGAVSKGPAEKGLIALITSKENNSIIITLK